MELTLDPIGGAWLTWIAAALLLAAPWVVPPRAIGLSPSRRRMLQLLRTLATLALLFAWLRPMLTRVSTELLRPSLVVLLDGSRSMTVEDALDGASRWEATRRLLAASESSLARLAEKRDVRAYLFGRDVTPLSIDAGRVSLPETPTGEETALGAALADTVNGAEASDSLSGVIVVSDGAQRARPPRDATPLSAIGRLSAAGAPLYAIPVGERAAGDRADVAIEDLVVSDTAFAGAPLEVRASLRVAGFPNRSVRVRLLWENAEGGSDPVDAAQVVVRQGVDSYPITLRHAPGVAGEWKLTVVADSLEGETVADNNTASTFVTVREGGVRVLYLAGTTRRGGVPGLEQRFIRSSLAASPDIALERIVIDYEPDRRDLTSRFAPGGADVIFLDNLDADGLSRASWDALSKRIEAGAGLAMLGGRQSFGPGGHRDTLGEVLPVRPGRAERQVLDAPRREDVHLPGPLRMVPVGDHPILRLSTDEGEDVWSELPPLDGANRLGDDLKPNATVLATTDDRRRPEPLLVLGQPGLGRVMAFAGDSTWRWVLAGKREAHQRLWRQAVLWLAKKDDDRSSRVYVDLATRRVPAGSRLDLAAGVRLTEEDSTSDAPIRYEAKVIRPDASEDDLPLPGGGARTTGVYVATSQPGDYRVRVTASLGETVLGQAESRFRVPRRDLELGRPGAEPDTLSRLAKATEADGGRTLALEELPALLKELAAAAPEERREVVSRTTLYDTWPVLLIFAALMTTEWLLRRRSGMP